MNIVLKYVLGASIGGVVGYFLFHRVIGCSTGACPITANPYISTLYGILLGLLLVGGVPSRSTGNAPGSTSSPQQAEAQVITAKEAKARMDSGDEVIIVDVRTSSEYRSGYIPGAILIPNETITATQPELLPDLDAEILLYCRSGNRSGQAAKKLAAMGYTNVYDFGGIIEWPYETATKP